MDDLFKNLDVIRKNYKNGLIDKTDTLGEMTALLVTATITNADDHRDKINKIDRDKGALDKIRRIVS